VRAALLAAAVAPTARAQSDGTGVRPEFRTDVTSGTVTSAELGVGLHIRSGTYFRAAALAGFGTAWRDGDRSSGARIELQGRFHLDPFREARLGVYGIGGVAATHDAFQDWQARKRREEQRLQEAVAPFVEPNPISVGGESPSDKPTVS